jgi:hypothetical protein
MVTCKSSRHSSPAVFVIHINESQLNFVGAMIIVSILINQTFFRNIHSRATLFMGKLSMFSCSISKSWFS